MLIFNVHEAVRLVHHVLLAAARVAEHLVTEEAEVAELYSLCNIGQKTFKRGHTVDVKDVEGMLDTHVVQAFLHSRELLITKKANAKGVQGSANRKSLIIRVNLVMALVVMYLIVIMLRVTRVS
jgi:hypothetical protein